MNEFKPVGTKNGVWVTLKRLDQSYDGTVQATTVERVHSFKCDPEDDVGMRIEDLREIGSMLTFAVKALLSAEGVGVGEGCYWSVDRQVAYVLRRAYWETGKGGEWNEADDS